MQHSERVLASLEPYHEALVACSAVVVVDQSIEGTVVFCNLGQELCRCEIVTFFPH